MPYTRSRRFQHKHETPEDRRRRQQGEQQPRSVYGDVAELHRRTWQDGPPAWWTEEHRQMQDETYFKLRRDR